MRGALQPVGSTPTSWATAVLRTSWEQALAPVLNAPSEVTAEDDPLLAPPLYGAAQAGLDTVTPTQTTRWFEQLNLSPVNRAIARLGTMVVQQRQDELMASAWDQAAELRRVNQLLRQTQFGERVTTSLHTRHVKPMDPAVGLQVLAPAQARMLRTSPALTNQLAGTGLAPTAFSTALRRVARPRGGLNRMLRRVSPTPIKLTTTVLVQLQPIRIMARIVAGAPDTGPVTFERVAAGFGFDVSWLSTTAQAVTDQPPRPFFAFVPMGVPVPMTGGTGPIVDPFPTLPVHPITGEFHDAAQPIKPGEPGPLGPPDPPIDPNPDPVHPTHPHPHPHPVPQGDSAAAKLFREVAAENLARFNPARISKLPGPMANGALETVFAEMVASTTPSETFATRARASFTIPGPARTDDIALDPVGLSPSFPQPMVEPLTEVAQRLVLPGLELVPPNTVVPLETNSTFVESYLVGLNTEMGRELLWREYPADLRATYFDRFWDASSSPGRPPDVADLSTWGDRALGVGAAEEDFVLLLRSELLRRYPDAIVYAMKGTEEKHPIFSGGFAPDVRFFGFDIDAATIGDWNIVIQEHPSAPRFGIEVGIDYRHGHARRARRVGCRAHREGRATAAGPDHHPGHRADEGRVMAIKVPDLGHILDHTVDGPPGLLTACRRLDRPAGALPGAARDAVLRQRAEGPGLSRQGAPRLPRPVAHGERAAVGPPLLGAAVAGRVRRRAAARRVADARRSARSRAGCLGGACAHADQPLRPTGRHSCLSRPGRSRRGGTHPAGAVVAGPLGRDGVRRGTCRGRRHRP